MPFSFGRNWRAFAAGVGEAEVGEAVQGLADAAGADAVRGKSFLDVGCGSGLSSLASLRLGASRVTAFDADPEAVRTARELLQRFAPGDARAEVRPGSVLDRDFLESLGTWDVVHAWGVLHHTGAMWRAVELTAERVAPGGRFVLALYNRTATSGLWRFVKRIGYAAPGPLRALMAAGIVLPRLAVRAFRGRHPLRDRRGMTVWRGAVDWIGGWPYEAATAEEVVAFLAARGFELQSSVLTRGTGCNEFVFFRR